MLEIEIHKDIGTRGHGTTNAEAFRSYTRGRGLVQNETNPEDVDSAIAQFQQALAIDPGYADAYASLGIGLMAKYKHDKEATLIEQSRQACEQSIALDFRLPEASICLGILSIATGRYEEAASHFQTAINEDPGNDEAYGNLAIAYERMGRSEQAEQAYQQAIAMRPQYAVGYDRLAVFYNHQTRYREAAIALENATKLAPRAAVYWASLGGTYYLSGDYQKALLALRHSIDVRPSFQAYNNLGNSYFALQRFPEAIAAFEQTVVLGPKQMQAHGNLARAYYWYPPKRSLARGEYLQAIALANDSLKINPKDNDAHLLIAQYYAMLGDSIPAVQHLEKALRASPNDAEALYFAAIVHAQLGDTQAAISWLRRAIAQGYSPSEILRTPELAALKNELGYKALLNQ
jgi:Flp pilus assembly protein TadD, contains TPR repeats